jgi:hypothetical protein
MGGVVVTILVVVINLVTIPTGGCITFSIVTRMVLTQTTNSVGALIWNQLIYTTNILALNP